MSNATCTASKKLLLPTAPASQLWDMLTMPKKPWRSQPHKSCSSFLWNQSHQVSTSRRPYKPGSQSQCQEWNQRLLLGRRMCEPKSRPDQEPKSSSHSALVWGSHSLHEIIERPRAGSSPSSPPFSYVSSFLPSSSSFLSQLTSELLEFRILKYLTMKAWTGNKAAPWGYEWLPKNLKCQSLEAWTESPSSERTWTSD